jgi:hypothetical protein
VWHDGLTIHTCSTVASVQRMQDLHIANMGKHRSSNRKPMIGLRHLPVFNRACRTQRSALTGAEQSSRIGEEQASGFANARIRTFATNPLNP